MSPSLGNSQLVTSVGTDAAPGDFQSTDCICFGQSKMHALPPDVPQRTDTRISKHIPTTENPKDYRIDWFITGSELSTGENNSPLHCGKYPKEKRSTLNPNPRQIICLEGFEAELQLYMHPDNWEGFQKKIGFVIGMVENAQIEQCLS